MSLKIGKQIKFEYEHILKRLSENRKCQNLFADVIFHILQKIRTVQLVDLTSFIII